MISRSRQRELTLSSAAEALRLRTDHGYDFQPICGFDIPVKLGLPLKFISAPTLEGMYTKAPGPAIFLSSERPIARQQFTCAHEVGHHIFNHGNSVDEYVEKTGRNDCTEEEFMANAFAAALLMPKLLVLTTFNSRGWKPQTAGATEIYLASRHLGVGYQTLVYHMAYSLGILAPNRANELTKIRLKDLRLKEFGTSANVTDLCHGWMGSSPVCEVGDSILISQGASLLAEQSKLTRKNFSKGTDIVTVEEPGTVVIRDESQGRVRFGVKGFVGNAKFRFLAA